MSGQLQNQHLMHREITLIELQSLVVFGCDSAHDREEGWDNFLFV